MLLARNQTPQPSSKVLVLPSLNKKSEILINQVHQPTDDSKKNNHQQQTNKKNNYNLGTSLNLKENNINRSKLTTLANSNQLRQPSSPLSFQNCKKQSLLASPSVKFNSSVLRLIQNKLYPLQKNRNRVVRVQTHNNSELIGDKKSRHAKFQLSYRQSQGNDTTNSKVNNNEHKVKKKNTKPLRYPGNDFFCGYVQKNKNSYEALQDKVDSYLRHKRVQLKQKYLDEKQVDSQHHNHQRLGSNMKAVKSKQKQTQNQYDTLKLQNQNQNQIPSNIGKYIKALKREMNLTKTEKQIQNEKYSRQGMPKPFYNYTSRGVDKQLLRDIMDQIMDQKSNKMRKNINHKKIIMLR